MTARCKGNHLRRISGPRVAARYGSWATEICLNCFRFRVIAGQRRWRFGKFPEIATDGDDDLPF